MKHTFPPSFYYGVPTEGPGPRFFLRQEHGFSISLDGTEWTNDLKASCGLLKSPLFQMLPRGLQGFLTEAFLRFCLKFTMRELPVTTEADELIIPCTGSRLLKLLARAARALQPCTDSV